MAILPVLSLLYAMFALSIATELKVVEKRNVCQPGWKAYGGRCFRLVTKPKNWSEAEVYCVSQGGHLASIHNSGEAQFVRNFAGNKHRIWIGAGRSCGAPGWYWTDGSSFAYTKWSKKQPDNWRSNEPCVHMYNGAGAWNDKSCSACYQFVCAKW
ncbi:galactose-specific lectin nattectin-like [Alosa pseudoharengus]|uniref:galactose-specific lectin nattectin-like n=1 Tax=Alosa pseudoharengus TaxID=34774 RepID=UPI003F899852